MYYRLNGISYKVAYAVDLLISMFLGRLIIFNVINVG